MIPNIDYLCKYCYHKHVLVLVTTHDNYAWYAYSCPQRKIRGVTPWIRIDNKRFHPHTIGTYVARNPFTLVGKDSYYEYPVKKVVDQPKLI